MNYEKFGYYYVILSLLLLIARVHHSVSYSESNPDELCLLKPVEEPNRYNNNNNNTALQMSSVPCDFFGFFYFYFRYRKPISIERLRLIRHYNAVYE